MAYKMKYRTNQNRRERKDFMKCIIPEFVEVLIHQIIFLKRVYPDVIYKKRRMFNLPVMMSRQPWVNDYISKVTQQMKTNIDERRAIVIYSVNVIFSRDGKGYQRFRVKLPNLTNIEFDSLGYEPSDFREKLEQHLSNILLRLAEVVAGLKEEEEGRDREWWVELTSTQEGLSKMMKRTKAFCLAEDGKYRTRGKVILPVYAFSDPLIITLHIETDKAEALVHEKPVEEKVESDEDMFAEYY